LQVTFIDSKMPAFDRLCGKSTAITDRQAIQANPARSLLGR
jgi:hypothetical protein